MRSEPIWLRLDVLLAVQEEQAAEFGGAIRVRDRGLLESAIARPQQAFTNDDPRPDICALGALYAIAIVKNHPFVDGNKRVGFVALQTFLEINGRIFTASDAEVIENVLELAAGSLSDEVFSIWVKRNCFVAVSRR